LKELSEEAQWVVVLPNLKSLFLISFEQLYYNNCNIHLNRSFLKVCKDNKIIIKGMRNRYDGLWDIPIKLTL
jgi:hypothetical protein